MLSTYTQCGMDTRWRGVFWGTLFGLCFPFVGTLVEIATPGAHLPFTAAGFLMAQQHTPLLWIIDAAPLILGIFGWLVRVPTPRTDSTYRSAYLLHLVVTLLGIVMLTMLGYTASSMLADAQRDQDTNLAGALRDRSVWVYGATHTNNAKTDRLKVAGAVAEMQGARDELAARYPRAIAATDTVWKMFFHQFRSTGRVDWETASQMRDSAGQLAEKIAQQDSNQQEKNVGLLTLGALSVLVSVLVSVTIIHRLREAEDAHHKNRMLLAQAQAMAHVGSWKVNCVTRSTIWSDEMFRLLGLPTGSCTPSLEVALRYVHPEDVPLIRNAVGHAHATGEGYTIQYRILPADGNSTRYVHSLCQVEVDPLTKRPIRLYGTVRDITLEREQSEALRLSETRYRALVDATNVMVWTVSTLGQASMDASPAWKAFTGQTAEQARGVGWINAIHEDDRLAIKQRIEQCLQAGDNFSLHYRLCRHDGVYRWVQSFAVPVRDDSGIREWVGTTRDITERKEAEDARRKMEAHLEALAVTDGLTGIANRRAFDERLAREHNRSLRLNQPLSLVLMDVDRFKPYNDAFGHPAGDAVLRTVAQLLSNGTRESDFVARYGGEEFAVILTDTSATEATKLVERLRQRVETARWAHRPVTASFGVATLSKKTTAADLIADADTALYRAKKLRNTVSHIQEVTDDTDDGADWVSVKR